MNKRIENIIEYLQEKNISCLLVDTPFDVLYLLHINQSFNYIELNIILLITKNKVFLVANPLSLALIQEFLPGGIETIEAETTAYVENHSRYLKEIREIIKKESLNSIGLTSVQYIDASEMCIRVENPIPYFAGIKTEEEIDLVRNSAAILKKVYAKINDMIYDGCGEIELRNLIDIELHNQGIEKRAFPTKVAFGKKTATIFPVSTMEKLKKNDIILIDMGGMYKG
ncbi:MAG: M24 family metallopeptidase [Candidatus Cloacimonadota bacterium]|nr:MAG: M24 family metallopeptidase [Candidatus Cloacimonadota bacterium]